MLTRQTSPWRGGVAMPRASWKGFLPLSLVSCPIYLSPATTRTKSIRLHQVWQPKDRRGDPIEDDEEDGQASRADREHRRHEAFQCFGCARQRRIPFSEMTLEPDMDARLVRGALTVAE